MGARFMKSAIALLVLVIISSVSAGVAEALTATVVMKVSRTAQDSIIKEGEDLSIDVQIEGVAPSSYRWFFNNSPIPFAVERVYNIEAATVADAGVYRLEAYDDAGRTLLSMDFSVRVIEKALPKAGDNTLGIAPVVAVMAALGLAMAAAVAMKRKRAAA